MPRVLSSACLERYAYLQQSSITAVISSDTNKLARRASKLDLVHSAGVCFVDLWDHGTGERAFVGRSGP